MDCNYSKVPEGFDGCLLGFRFSVQVQDQAQVQRRYTQCRSPRRAEKWNGLVRCSAFRTPTIERTEGVTGSGTGRGVLWGFGEGENQRVTKLQIRGR